jgi:bifunctional non-homologous end joining protein LigD
LVDLLEIYRNRRDFTRTPEPAGSLTLDPRGARFVVQRHRASRLHYDLRFEIDGVLVSWAVPKGPTLDPNARRLAMHVEDHPIEYLHFEGIIPAGEYGGGDVIVWDTGTWEPVKTDEPRAAVARGELHAEVYGEKLRGRLVLVRRENNDDNDQAGDAWLLLHKHDEHAVDGWDPERHPRSVLSGRTNEEVSADPDRLWRSDAPAVEASVSLLPEPIPDSAIDELGALGKRGTWEVFGRRLKVTNLDKVLFPGSPPVTKRELLAYVARIAPVAVPYLKGRPLNRYPDGAEAKGFWHKQRPEHAPPWLGGWDNVEADEGETTTYVVADELAALVWAANFGALEWHPWTSTTDAPHEPTYALIDLDPGERTSWDDLLVLARLHRTALEHLGVIAAARSPDAAASRSGFRSLLATPLKTAVPGSRSSRELSARWCRSWSAGSGRSNSARDWPDWTTPRTRSTRPWSRPTRRGRPSVPQSRSPSGGTSWTTRIYDQIVGRSVPPWTDSLSKETPSASSLVPPKPLPDIT